MAGRVRLRHVVDQRMVHQLRDLAAAIAGATEQIRIRLSLVLLPLYHPLRAAEDSLHRLNLSSQFSVAIQRLIQG